jgi:hypothetical protein
MVTYLNRRVVIKTSDGETKEVTRHVREARPGSTTAFYAGRPQRVRCTGNAQDKNATWSAV